MAENRICTRCVMDTSYPGITFDEQGHCDLCNTPTKKIGGLRLMRNPPKYHL